MSGEQCSTRRVNEEAAPVIQVIDVKGRDSGSSRGNEEKWDQRWVMGGRGGSSWALLSYSLQGRWAVVWLVILLWSLDACYYPRMGRESIRYNQIRFGVVECDVSVHYSKWRCSINNMCLGLWETKIWVPIKEVNVKQQRVRKGKGGESRGWNPDKRRRNTLVFSLHSLNIS